MCVGNRTHRRKNNKRYGWLKRKFSEQRKKDSKGKGNNQYGTMWINKIGTTENRKIKKGDPIPDGWRRGRRIERMQDTIYITNIEEKTHTRIRKDDPIPDGWIVGRVDKWDVFDESKVKNGVYRHKPKAKTTPEERRSKKRADIKKTQEILDFIEENSIESIPALFRMGKYIEFGYPQKLTNFLKRHDKERFQSLIKAGMIGKKKV